MRSLLLAGLQCWSAGPQRRARPPGRAARRRSADPSPAWSGAGVDTRRPGRGGGFLRQRQQSALRHAHSSVARSIEGTNPILWTRRAPAPHSSETAKLRQRPLPRRRRRLQQQPTWRRAARPATPGFEPPAPQAAAAQPPAALQRPPRGPPPRCA